DLVYDDTSTDERYVSCMAVFAYTLFNVVKKPKIITVSAPGQVTGLVVLTKSTTTTKINFTKPANASSYEYRLNGGDPQILRSDSIITGLSSATTYTIEVRARNSAGAGPWSSTVNVTTDTAIGIPGTVV